MKKQQKSDRQKLVELMQWVVSKYPDMPTRHHNNLAPGVMVYFVRWEFFNLKLDKVEIGYRHDCLTIDGLPPNIGDFKADKFFKDFKQRTNKAVVATFKADKESKRKALEQELAELDIEPTNSKVDKAYITENADGSVTHHRVTDIGPPTPVDSKVEEESK